MKTFELLVIGAVFILTWPAVVFAEFTFTSIDVYMKLHQDGDEKREFSDEDETTVVHQLTSPLGTEFSVDFDLDLTHDQAWLDFEMSFDATSSGVKGSYVGMISTAMEYSVRVDGDVEVDWDFAYSGPTPFGLQTIRILINGVLWKVLGSFGLSGTHQGIHSISVLAGSTVSVQTLFNPNAAGDIFLLDGSSSGTIHYSFPGCGQVRK